MPTDPATGLWSTPIDITLSAGLYRIIATIPGAGAFTFFRVVANPCVTGDNLTKAILLKYGLVP